MTDNLKKIAEQILFDTSDGWNFQVSETRGNTQLDENLLCSKIFEKSFLLLFKKFSLRKTKISKLNQNWNQNLKNKAFLI